LGIFVYGKYHFFEQIDAFAWNGSTVIAADNHGVENGKTVLAAMQ